MFFLLQRSAAGDSGGRWRRVSSSAAAAAYAEGAGDVECGREAVAAAVRRTAGPRRPAQCVGGLLAAALGAALLSETLAGRDPLLRAGRLGGWQEGRCRPSDGSWGSCQRLGSARCGKQCITFEEELRGSARYSAGAAGDPAASLVDCALRAYAGASTDPAACSAEHTRLQAELERGNGSVRCWLGARGAEGGAAALCVTERGSGARGRGGGAAWAAAGAALAAGGCCAALCAV
eukprot:TRINITY_DN38233_c0_g1_i1.p2 TRINITY_DN38233_c0_g1~~TRINITY_DN38233_c0_g1_i1.p2  ORF type:complete len:259 (+),score=72.59 TRINITY_DN38233_c0_g1_i1:77-778(+)